MNELSDRPAMHRAAADYEKSQFDDRHVVAVAVSEVKRLTDLQTRRY